MGALERDPFAEDKSTPTELHSVGALHDMADLLKLVHYWRSKFEALEAEKQFRIARWRSEQKK